VFFVVNGFFSALSASPREIKKPSFCAERSGIAESIKPIPIPAFPLKGKGLSFSALSAPSREMVHGFCDSAQNDGNLFVPFVFFVVNGFFSALSASPRENFFVLFAFFAVNHVFGSRMALRLSGLLASLRLQ
jgi:hypothetical protein